MSLDLPKRPQHADFERRTFTLEEMRYLGAQTTFKTLGFKDCPITDEHVRELSGLAGLERLFLDGSDVTDAALEHVARLPKLAFLSVDRTIVTGEGFAHLAGHQALKTLWASQTDLTDATVRLAAGVPKLSILRIAKTAVTFDGLMPLAVHPTLTVNGDAQFTSGQMSEFRSTNGGWHGRRRGPQWPRQTWQPPRRRRCSPSSPR